ncbi:MAG: hypothetical protein CM15mV34_0610 [Caudoviricetes sp.]|nr:MAG: hypothetical protein CM15mV34_0610 [Caudoviricetes sp.]
MKDKLKFLTHLVCCQNLQNIINIMHSSQSMHVFLALMMFTSDLLHGTDKQIGEEKIAISFNMNL